MEYFLAIDIGASSGRHVLGHLENGQVITEEIHRFGNQMIEKDGTLCWDTDYLFREIIRGMKQCHKVGKIPVSVGIDTWGVDFVLLDENQQVLGNTVAYRDSRTEGMDQVVYKTISEEALYERTGIQKQLFNTIYQLVALKEKQPDLLSRAKSILLIPDYLHYLLTGVMKNEYTNATTGQLVSPETKDWDYDLLEALGLPSDIFNGLIMPGTVLGGLQDSIVEQVGYQCQVTVPATHDTASAVIAVPVIEGQPLYISSGTWSLMGVETMTANCSPISREKNFTNEGGYDYRFRYLKNIMGLWMIQSVRKEMSSDHSFADLCDMASKVSIASIVDCNDDRFIAPKSMIQAVQDYCEETKQVVPGTDAEIASVIYNSLSVSYKEAAKEIEDILGTTYDAIHIVGGGSNAAYLNQLTANRTGKTVHAGPAEGTAIGNLLVQMIQAGQLKDLQHARQCLKASIDIETYPVQSNE